MPLIPQDENKQRNIYKICCFFLILFWLFFGVFFICINFLHLNRHWQNIIGFTFMGSFIPTLIAIHIIYQLKLTNHYEARSYTLPYKTRREHTLFYILIGLFLLTFISTYIYSLTQDIVILLLLIFALIGLLSIMVTWNGIILFEDHLCSYILWNKKDISYMDIVRVNIEKAYYKGARHYVLAIKTRYEYKPLLRINLTPISKSDRIIILNVIHQFAPHATMNELAEQMRNGDFPVA